MLLLAIFILSLMSMVNDQMMKNLFSMRAGARSTTSVSYNKSTSSLLTLSDCMWLVIASGTCWPQSAKVRWASACYQADMEKRSCIAPEHFGSILTLKICCCTWNSLALRASEANAGVELSGDKLIKKLGWVVGVEPTTSRATVWRSATELYPP